MQTDPAILSQIEILTSTRLAAVVVDKLKLDQNDAFMNPPVSAWPRASVSSGLIQYVRIPALWPGDCDISQTRPATRDALIATSGATTRSSEAAERGAARARGSYVIALGYQATDPALAHAITKAYAEAYLADQLDASFDATERAAVWLQGRLTELRESSQAASLAVEKFRAEHGLAANSDGQLMSDKQLSDLNAQLIVAQADTARASARYQQYKAIVDSGSDNAFKDAAISSDQPSSWSSRAQDYHGLRAAGRRGEFRRPASAGGGACQGEDRHIDADFRRTEAADRKLSQ